MPGAVPTSRPRKPPGCLLENPMCRGRPIRALGWRDCGGAGCGSNGLFDRSAHQTVRMHKPALTRTVRRAFSQICGEGRVCSCVFTVRCGCPRLFVATRSACRLAVVHGDPLTHAFRVRQPRQLAGRIEEHHDQLAAGEPGLRGGKWVRRRGADASSERPLLRPNYAQSAEPVPVMVSRLHAKRSQRNLPLLRSKQGTLARILRYSFSCRTQRCSRQATGRGCSVRGDV